MQGIVKVGPSQEIATEAVHLSFLPVDLRPELFVVVPVDGERTMMVMQDVPDYDPQDKLVIGYRFLDQIWRLQRRHPTPYWVTQFEARFGFSPPTYITDEEDCLIHGDPTGANIRVDLLSNKPVFIDPKPPGRGIPSRRSVDIGKLLQSYVGWEVVLTAKEGLYHPGYSEFPFDELSPLDLRRGMFWCMIHLLRICQREPDGSDIYNWANGLANMIKDQLCLFGIWTEP